MESLLKALLGRTSSVEHSFLVISKLTVGHKWLLVCSKIKTGEESEKLEIVCSYIALL